MAAGRAAFDRYCSVENLLGVARPESATGVARQAPPRPSRTQGVPPRNGSEDFDRAIATSTAARVAGPVLPPPRPLRGLVRPAPPLVERLQLAGRPPPLARVLLFRLQRRGVGQQLRLRL